MRQVRISGIVVTAAFALTVGLFFALAAQDVEARPQYKKAFDAKFGDKIEKSDCRVCHPKESKKIKNNYGEAFGKALGAKNEKDEKKIGEAFEKANKGKSKIKGKTFGDLIEEGKLPASEE